MLGSMTYSYLSTQSTHSVTGTSRNINRKTKNAKYFDVHQFLANPTKFTYLKQTDYIINCIGIIKPYCKDDDPIGVKKAMVVNSIFSHKLNDFLFKTKVKIIQIATDCVYSGKKGNYKEDDLHDALDVYGKTKSLGEIFNGNFLNIRCSIIGPERKNKLSLLEWFLNQKDGSEIQGFSHHKWNGVTTLQFAQLCEKIINKDFFDKLIKISHTHHFVPNNSVTKFELLNTFKEVFHKDINIKKVNNVGLAVDRRLSTKFSLLLKVFPKTNIKKALQELKGYI